MVVLTEEEKGILERIRSLRPDRRKTLLEAIWRLDDHPLTPEEQKERRERLERITGSWGLSSEEARHLIDEVHAMREVEE